MALTCGEESDDALNGADLLVTKHRALIDAGLALNEGAGGLMVPLSADCDMIDLFDRWNLPVILVASTALGTINHTLLSLAAMRARHIRIAGVAFVGAENAPTETFIAHKASVERLGRLPHLPALDRPSLHAAFAEGFDLARLKRALAHLDTGSPDWQAP
jgi:dethiobiotin synthetase